MEKKQKPPSPSSRFPDFDRSARRIHKLGSYQKKTGGNTVDFKIVNTCALTRMGGCRYRRGLRSGWGTRREVQLRLERGELIQVAA